MVEGKQREKEDSAYIEGGDSDSGNDS
jgi:hypothetical protein